MPTVEEIKKALMQVIDPELGSNIVDLGMVQEVQVDGGEVRIKLALTMAGCPMKNFLEEQTKQAALGVPGVKNVVIDLTTMTDQQRRELKEHLSPAGSMNKIGKVIAVISGKGGVGKSSVTAMLATALRRAGYEVGVLDADITGPSIPRMFGVTGPVQGIPLGILPVETKTGIRVMSTNLLLEQEDMAVIWRGPVMSGAIKQFWGDVLWGRLDYLLVDLPPGTSDATLTVMQSMPLNGCVMVTTPQSLAAMVVRKTIHMSENLGIPILGVVENMSYYPCPETGQRHEIFGQSHADEVASAAKAPVLARLPIDPAMATMADNGSIEGYDHPAYADLVCAFMQIPIPDAAPQN